jgi:hypothetical protein
MPDSFNKRQKEIHRLEKRREKAAKRMQRKVAAKAGDSSQSPELDGSGAPESDVSDATQEAEVDRSSI